MSDTNTTMDEFRNNVVKPELFRGKQTVREMIRTLSEEMQRRMDALEKRLDAIERSI